MFLETKVAINSIFWPPREMRRRGRPLSHLSKRVASGVWYCNVIRVYENAQSSDDNEEISASWLDRTLLNPTGATTKIDSADRQRVFERIKTERRSPNHDRYRNCHDGNRTYNLLALVEAAKPGTAVLYTSDVWRLLGPSPTDLPETQRVIATLLMGRGLRRVNSLIALVQASNVPSTHPRHPRVANRQVLSGILREAGPNEPSIDSLALVCALAREAALFGSREVMWDRLEEVNEAARRFAAPLPMDLVEDLRKDFETLFRDFSENLPREASLPLSFGDVHPHSAIVPDTEQSRMLEEKVLREIRHSIGQSVEKRMAQLDEERPGWDSEEFL